MEFFFAFFFGMAAGGVAFSGLVNWLREISERKQARKSRDSVAAYIERLAALKNQGDLSEKEFEEQKRRCLAEVEQKATGDLSWDTPLGHVQRLSGLKDNEVLTEQEFQTLKSRYLHLGAEAPTDGELAGIEHIEKLATLHDNEVITRDEFEAQKREILEAGCAATAKPASPWGDFDEP